MTAATRGHDVIHAGESVLLHVAAIVGGLALMILGVAMGVTIALIPLGVPIGFLGFGMILWGLGDHIQARRRGLRH
ncbi:MAG: hypothetical protein ACYTGN_12615 [Planctomycetota bacterium]|jgi:hypothetical protein